MARCRITQKRAGNSTPRKLLLTYAAQKSKFKFLDEEVNDNDENRKQESAKCRLLNSTTKLCDVDISGAKM